MANTDKELFRFVNNPKYRNFSWYEWGPVFYNYTATKMKVEKVTIKYFGGSTKQSMSRKSII